MELPSQPGSNKPPGAQSLQRLGQNLNRYCGETLDLDAVLADCLAAARTHGWSIEQLSAEPAPTLLAFHRPALSAAARPLRLYLSAGIHGDEPAGPLAVRQLLRENPWPATFEVWLCPCLNPAGFRFNRRENGEGLDLNRQYFDPQATETRAHIRWLERQPVFDLCLCLHEDWESHGFYVYELNPDNRSSLAPAIVAAVAAVCPIDYSPLIEGRPAQDGIIRPSADPRSRPQWPEAFFLLSHKTRLSYTLEAPSDFILPCRVAALVKAVEVTLATVAPGSDAVA